MSGKIKTAYVCSNCGYQSAKWSGRCNNCGEWNALEETVVSTQKNVGIGLQPVSATAVKINEISSDFEPRTIIGINELDRVLGGGIVNGSVVLLSGDPGIGKSTILLQVCKSLPDNLKILYVSGEESCHQIKLRAERLGVKKENLYVMSDNNTQSVCDYIISDKPNIVMIDSIQTMQIPELQSSAGSIVQVRESTTMLLKVAKSNNIPLFIVGHVNKGGDIAGPKVLEHIVDTVLYFEGDRNQSYRILRAIKNRFGSTNEIGVFEMSENGLNEVENPSATILSGRAKDVSGSCVACILEGSRPILSEVQALVTPTGFGNARRVATGFDYNRLNMLLAVLEKRIGLHFSNRDVYVNVAGGLRLDEPAADLPVALSLVSGLRDTVIDEDIIAFGEIGLSGELRTVSNPRARVNEAARLGFKICILPNGNLKQLKDISSDIKVIGVLTLKEAITKFLI
ncbi:MAG: DNA repair protein RadA [Acutalibacteraceae bacterium]|nr:DNA repair protein RadA [Acutalibacteraceae bacterium]